MVPAPGVLPYMLPWGALFAFHNDPVTGEVVANGANNAYCFYVDPNETHAIPFPGDGFMIPPDFPGAVGPLGDVQFGDPIHVQPVVKLANFYPEAAGGSGIHLTPNMDTMDLDIITAPNFPVYLWCDCGSFPNLFTISPGSLGYAWVFAEIEYEVLVCQ
jgi:hypothetical protein